MKKILCDKVTDEVFELANGSISRAQKLLEPEYTEMRDKVNKFLSSSPKDRLKTLQEMEHLELREVLIYSQQLYISAIRQAQIVTKTKASNDIYSTLSILDALMDCEKGFKALKQNVHKKLILYWLANTLPILNSDKKLFIARQD